MFLLFNVSTINSLGFTVTNKACLRVWKNSAQICANYSVKSREQQPKQNKYNETDRAALAWEIRPVLIG